MDVKMIFDTYELRNEGKNIKTYAGKMYDELENVKKEMQNSTSCFDSDAGKTLRQNFEASAKKFEEFKKVMEDYGDYLIKLADQKEERNRNLNDAASKIPKLEG